MQMKTNEDERKSSSHASRTNIALVDPSRRSLNSDIWQRLQEQAPREQHRNDVPYAHQVGLRATLYLLR